MQFHQLKVCKHLVLMLIFVELIVFHYSEQKPLEIYHIQTIPLSITALDGDTIQDKLIFNFQDIQMRVPSVSQFTADPGRTRIAIRGLGGFAASPMTGVYFDDSPVSDTQTD